MRGCISIIELLKFTIFCPFWASLGEALFEKSCDQDAIRRTKTHNCIGREKFQGDAAGGSKLIEQTLQASKSSSFTIGGTARKYFH